MKIQRVNPNFVQQVWPQIEGFLNKGESFSGGEYTVDQLRTLVVLDQQALLVFLEDEFIVGAATVAFENYPNHRIAVVTSLGGKAIFSQEYNAPFREWCRTMGATLVRGCVRESMAKLCEKELGMVRRYIVMEQSL